MTTNTPDGELTNSFFRTFKTKTKRGNTSSCPAKQKLKPKKLFVEAIIVNRLDLGRHTNNPSHVKTELPNGELEIVDSSGTYYVNTAAGLFQA
jgi:hypothetical protein